MNPKSEELKLFKEALAFYLDHTEEQKDDYPFFRIMLARDFTKELLGYLECMETITCKHIPNWALSNYIPENELEVYIKHDIAEKLTKELLKKGLIEFVTKEMQPEDPLSIPSEIIGKITVLKPARTENMHTNERTFDGSINPTEGC